MHVVNILSEVVYIVLDPVQTAYDAISRSAG